MSVAWLLKLSNMEAFKIDFLKKLRVVEVKSWVTANVRGLKRGFVVERFNRKRT